MSLAVFYVITAGVNKKGKINFALLFYASALEQFYLSSAAGVCVCWIIILLPD